VHLEADTGRPIPDSVPALVEGFRDRRLAALGQDQLPFGDRIAMWSDRIVDRPRLGTAGYRSRFHLVSVGDHQTDRFRHYANCFTVVVPWPFIRDRTSMDQFERLIDEEKPAHVAHDVVVIEPWTIVGKQCRLGVDTYVGAPRVVRLASACDDWTVGPRLGVGTVLGRRDVLEDRPPAVGCGARLDAGTALI
jgi:hypothetical protein